MTIIFDFLKRFLSGFNLGSSAVIGKVIYYGILFLIFMTVYTKLTAPRPVQQTITAQTAVVQAAAPENKKKAFLGVKVFGLGAGLFWE